MASKAITAIKNHPYKIESVIQAKKIHNVGDSTCKIIQKYLDKNL